MYWIRLSETCRILKNFSMCSRMGSNVSLIVLGAIPDAVGAIPHYYELHISHKSWNRETRKRHENRLTEKMGEIVLIFLLVSSTHVQVCLSSLKAVLDALGLILHYYQLNLRMTAAISHLWIRWWGKLSWVVCAAGCQCEKSNSIFVEQGTKSPHACREWQPA